MTIDLKKQGVLQGSKSRFSLQRATVKKLMDFHYYFISGAKTVPVAAQGNKKINSCCIVTPFLLNNSGKPKWWNW
ncbi:MAG: hypothetical protein GXY54_08255 [Deltaproteobacteria bacterium]|nr:hypothetical protein [Deltaproteobacteria bacterium]